MDMSEIKEGSVRDGFKVVASDHSLMCEAPYFWCDSVCSFCKDKVNTLHWERVHKDGRVTSEINKLRDSEKVQRRMLRRYQRMQYAGIAIALFGFLLCLNVTISWFGQVSALFGGILCITGVVLYLYGFGYYMFRKYGNTDIQIYGNINM